MKIPPKTLILASSCHTYPQPEQNENWWLCEGIKRMCLIPKRKENSSNKLLPVSLLCWGWCVLIQTIQMLLCEMCLSELYILSNCYRIKTLGISERVIETEGCCMAGILLKYRLVVSWMTQGILLVLLEQRKWSWFLKLWAIGTLPYWSFSV